MSDWPPTGVDWYYSDDAVAIAHGDCREIMPRLAPVDLVLTDPPYFRVKGESWDRAWDNDEAFLEWIAEVSGHWQSLILPNGSLYCFASPQMGARVEVVLRLRFNVLNRIRWIKRNGWHRKAEREALRSYLSPWEEIIFAESWWSDGSADKESGYGDATRELHKRVYSPVGDYIKSERERAGFTRNEVEVSLGYISSSDPLRGTALCCRWEEGSSLPSKNAYERLRVLLNSRGGEYLRKDYEDLRKDYEDLRKDYEDLRKDYEDLRKDYEDLRRPFNAASEEDAYDIWHFETVPPNETKHPCEKPIGLLKHAILKSTKDSAIVLDSFAGTGSTLVAAKELRRRAIGIERCEEYCEIAARRCSQEVLDFGERMAQNSSPTPSRSLYPTST